MPEDRSVLTRPAPPPSLTRAIGDDPDQVADIYLPDAVDPGAQATPVVLIHGGFWRPEYDRRHLRPMAAALAERGYPTALVEYRRIPGDPRSSADDVARALASLGRLHPDLDAGAPVIVGHSAGGHLALLAAQSSEPARACLALAPVADLGLADALDLDGGAVRAFLGGPATDHPELDPARLPGPAMPVTVLHGRDDSVVPAQLSRAYCDRTGSRLVELPAVAHFELIDPASTAWPTVIVELDALARPGGIE